MASSLSVLDASHVAELHKHLSNALKDISDDGQMQPYEMVDMSTLPVGVAEYLSGSTILQSLPDNTTIPVSVFLKRNIDAHRKDMTPPPFVKCKYPGAKEAVHTYLSEVEEVIRTTPRACKDFTLTAAQRLAIYHLSEPIKTLDSLHYWVPVEEMNKYENKYDSREHRKDLSVSSQFVRVGMFRPITIFNQPPGHGKTVQVMAAAIRIVTSKMDVLRGGFPCNACCFNPMSGLCSTVPNTLLPVVMCLVPEAMVTHWSSCAASLIPAFSKMFNVHINLHAYCVDKTNMKANALSLVSRTSPSIIIASQTNKTVVKAMSNASIALAVCIIDEYPVGKMETKAVVTIIAQATPSIMKGTMRGRPDNPLRLALLPEGSQNSTVPNLSISHESCTLMLQRRQMKPLERTLDVMCKLHLLTLPMWMQKIAEMTSIAYMPKHISIRIVTFERQSLVSRDETVSAKVSLNVWASQMAKTLSHIVPNGAFLESIVQELSFAPTGQAVYEALHRLFYSPACTKMEGHAKRPCVEGGGGMKLVKDSEALGNSAKALRRTFMSMEAIFERQELWRCAICFDDKSEEPPVLVTCCSIMYCKPCFDRMCLQHRCPLCAQENGKGLEQTVPDAVKQSKDDMSIRGRVTHTLQTIFAENTTMSRIIIASYANGALNNRNSTFLNLLCNTFPTVKIVNFEREMHQNARSAHAIIEEFNDMKNLQPMVLCCDISETYTKTIVGVNLVATTHILVTSLHVSDAYMSQLVGRMLRMSDTHSSDSKVIYFFKETVIA